jgi:hypothetical protein
MGCYERMVFIMTKFTIMTMDDAKEICEFFENHETALIHFGAEMYRKGMIKGGLIFGGGTVIGMITKPIADKLVKKVKEKHSKGE